MDLYDLFFMGGEGDAPAPTLIDKTITENGEYSASDDNADGYKTVDVSVEAQEPPTLYAPTISRSGDTINISNPSTNGGFVTKYKIYNGNTALSEQTTTSFSLIGLGAGTYSLSVAASGTDFKDSPKSNVINASVYTITRTLENLTANNNTALIGDNQTYNVTLTPTSGYYLPEDITVTMGGVTTTAYTYDSYTGAISIAAVSGNIVITASALSMPKLRRPTLSLSGTNLTITPPLYAETTNVYVNGTIEQTYTGTSAQVFDLTNPIFRDYGIYTIGAQSEATGYTNSDLVTVQYNVGATISITGNTLTIVDVISGVTSYGIYVDDTLVDTVANSGSTIDLSSYASSIQDGKHYVSIDAIGSGIASNRSNAEVWFVGAAPIYGVSGLADVSASLTRTDDAVNLSYNINSSSGAITSDFNDVFPWNEAEIINDTAGKFLQFPEMYFRVGVNSSSQITDVAVSKIPSGTGNWYRVAPFAYACYGASLSGSNLRSTSGVARQANKTRANFRTYASNVGSGYIQLDVYHRTVLDFLWLIEWATKNSQSVMTGRISGSGTSGGSTALNTGGTDGVTTPSGFETVYGQMRYHYIEDFVGNLMEFADGVCMPNANSPYYVTADPTKFADTTTNMSATSYNAPSSGYIFALGWDTDNPFLVLPVTTGNGASATAGFCDYAFVNGSSYPVLYVGAYYDNSYASYGVFYAYSNSVSGSGGSIGARLLKIS